MKVYLNKEKTIYLNINKSQGKMTGILALSTDKRLNENCQKLSQDPSLICSKCYVERSLKQYRDLEPCLIHNQQLLTSRLLTQDEVNHLDFLKNTMYFRFESFGDLNNDIQLTNYMNIAKTFKTCNFALWTKHFNLLLTWLKNHKAPKNIRLILSSPKINGSINNMLLDVFKKYHKNTISFNVTSDKKDPNINCGKRKCINCLNCYKKGVANNVLELLK